MRKTILPFLSVLVVSIAACKHGCLPCDLTQINACQSKNPPIVCIDGDTLIPSQNPVHIKSGQTAHFYLTTGRGTLTIICDPKASVDYVSHDSGHAWVHAKPVDKAEQTKYTIDVDGRKNDPEMVIEP
jgi:hypothetical protein